MYACNGSDEIAVRHVCDGGEVGFVAAGGGDATACFDPLSALFSVRFVGIVCNGQSLQ